MVLRGGQCVKTSPRVVQPVATPIAGAPSSSSTAVFSLGKTKAKCGCEGAREPRTQVSMGHRTQWGRSGWILGGQQGTSSTVLLFRHPLLSFTDSWVFSISSVQLSRSVVADSLPPHESQHTRPACTSPTTVVYSNSCPSSW